MGEWRMDGKSYSNNKITLKTGKMMQTLIIFGMRELDILYYMRGIVVAFFKRSCA